MANEKGESSPSMLSGPELLSHHEGGAELSMALWRFPSPVLALSSAPYGGGWGLRHWILLAQVPHSYQRADPAVHMAELADGLRLPAHGVGMLTAVDVRTVRSAWEGDVAAVATVGLSHPTWAAADDQTGNRVVVADGGTGTINIVVMLARRLCRAALVNAVMTATEAKSQALWDAGFAATGTPSDAVAIFCSPSGAEEMFAGPRSVCGSRLARTVHLAVLDGARAGGSR